jgi:hypothetical protein
VSFLPHALAALSGAEIANRRCPRSAASERQAFGNGANAGEHRAPHVGHQASLREFWVLDISDPGECGYGADVGACALFGAQRDKESPGRAGASKLGRYLRIKVP